MIETLITHYADEYTLARLAKMEEALRIIATPIRPDGSWNRDREACQKIAEEALRGG